MDVTCDRCGTEYEFEEALVSTRGTTVKCTQCGHLFKVYRPAASAAPDARKNPWTVKRSDGSIHRLSSLADLTRLIEEGAFGREDELSRTGKAWKRLADIEELDLFFARAHAASSVRPRRVTGAPQLGLRKAPRPLDAADSHEAEHGAPLAAAVAGSAPPVATPAGGVPMQVGPSGPASVQPGTATPPMAAGQVPAASPVAPPVAPAAPASASASIGQPGPGPERSEPPDSIPDSRRQLQPRPARSPAKYTAARRDLTAEPRPAEVDTEAPTIQTERSKAQAELRGDYEPFAKRRAPVWIWVFVVLATVGAFASWLLWPMIDRDSVEQARSGSDPAVAFLARADAAFATHRVARFEEALTDYVKALAFHENDPHVLSSISRVYGVWAQELIWEANALADAIGSSQDLEKRSTLLALRNEARELGEQAKRNAESAARKNPGNEEAEIALSDALRLTGNLVAARAELDRARLREDRASAETLRVAALLAIAEAQGDLRAGLELASQAVARDPELIRARLLLARCLFADGDLVGGRYQLAAVTTRDRSHPGVQAIELALSQPKPEPTPEANSGGDDARTKPARAQEADERLDEKEPSFDNMSHEAYIARGQKLLEAGQVTNAKRLFEQALFIRPSSPEAHAGLGFIALEKARPKLAVEHFLEAKRGGNAEALIGLGEAYRRMSRPREALRAYTSYLSEHPQGPQVGIARAQVERLSEDAGASKK